MKNVCLYILTLMLISCATVERAETMKIGGLTCLRDTEKPLTGKIVDYYQNTSLKEETHYKKGVLHGKSTKWHDNGEKQEQGTWNLGVKDGLWIYWRMNGELYMKTMYENGEAVD